MNLLNCAYINFNLFTKQIKIAKALVSQTVLKTLFPLEETTNHRSFMI